MVIFQLVRKGTIKKWWKNRKKGKDKKQGKSKKDKSDDEGDEEKKVKKKTAKKKSSKTVGGKISYWKFILAISASILISIIFIYLVVWVVKYFSGFNLIQYILT